MFAYVIILVVLCPLSYDQRDTLTRSQLSMITARAERVWRGTFDAQQDFSSYGASPIMIPQPPTSRVVRRRQTWPSASRVRPGSAWSGWARWDRQRTMYTRGSPAAHPGLSRASTSADFRELAWTADCESASRAVISTDRQTGALSDSKFWPSLDGTLGSENARGARRS